MKNIFILQKKGLGNDMAESKLMQNVQEAITEAIEATGISASVKVIPENKETGEIINDRIEYWRNLYFEEKEKNKELLKEYNKKLGADWEDAISKDVLREKFEKLNKATKGENFLQEYMILGNSGRATGWFINLDFIEKVIFNEPGYILKED